MKNFGCQEVKANMHQYCKCLTPTYDNESENGILFTFSQMNQPYKEVLVECQWLFVTTYYLGVLYQQHREAESQQPLK